MQVQPLRDVCARVVGGKTLSSASSMSMSKGDMLAAIESTKSAKVKDLEACPELAARAARLKPCCYYNKQGDEGRLHYTSFSSYEV